MLHLIERNKGGRNLNGIVEEGTNWKAVFKTTEDSLTSSIFGLLFYLPLELFWRILSKSSYDFDVFPNPGRIKSYSFWPRWETEDNSFKEPDLFIEFENFNLIIEAKRYDYNQQYSQQWKEEINSYMNTFETEKEVYFLAVGGICDGNEMTDYVLANNQKLVPIVKCRWVRVLYEIQVIQGQLGRSKDILHSNDSVLNVLSDLVLAFRVHGFQTGSLLNSMPTNIKLSKPTKTYIDVLRFQLINH